MDKTALVGIDIDEGRKFLDLLHESGIPVSAALWQQEDQMEEWSLKVVTPLVEELGLRGAYDVVDRTLSEAVPPVGIDLLIVSLLGEKYSFSKSLKRGLRRVRERPVGGQRVGDHVLQKGYVYFVK